jgi:hypothetical protein
MTSPEIFVEELAGVFESGLVAKIHLASVIPGADQPERAVVCRLVGSISDLRQIAVLILDALKTDEDSVMVSDPEPDVASDEVVIGIVS